MVSIAALLAAGVQPAAAAPQGEGGRVYLGLGLGVSAAVADETSGIPFTVIDGFDPTGQPITRTERRSFDRDNSVGGASHFFVGYRVSSRFSIEIESAAWVSESEYWVGDYVGTNLLSVNGVAWGDQRGPFVPYGGLGLGYSRFVGDDGAFDFFDGRVAGKAKVGLVAPVGRSHGLGIEANAVVGPAFEGGTGIGQEANAFGLTATYRYQFGGFAGR